jgi:hypothetical protein
MKQLHTLWLLICLTGFLAELFSQQQILSDSSSECYTNSECLIKFKHGTNRSVIDSLSSSIKFSILEYYPDGNFYRVRIPKSIPVHTFISKVLQNSNTEFAQPDYFISFFTSSCDFIFPPLWYTGPVENGGSNLEAAQKFIGNVSSDITVAIIGDGLLPDTFPELFKNIRTLPINITQQNRVGRISSLIESIWYSLNNGAQIIAVLAGTPDAPLLKNAIEQAFNRGTTIFCAAADSVAQAKSHLYPAAYNQYCIAVTAHGNQGGLFFNSSAGDYIDLSAPAEILFSKTSKPGRAALCGSPVATLYVTATAAMLSGIGINGYDKIRQALEQSCFDPVPKGWDRISGWGFLDALKAVQYFPKPNHDIMISSFKVPRWGIQGEQLQVIVTVKNQGNFVHDASMVLTDQTTSKILSSATATIKPDQSSQFVFQWNTEKELLGSHLLSITAPITGDEDVADNTQYKEVTIVNDTRDIEIAGVECNSVPDEHAFNSSVELWNKGTYTEMVTVKVQDLTGAILGQKDTSIHPQSVLSMPVYCTISDLGKEKFVKVTVETSDLQEKDLSNNSYFCPLIFSSKSSASKPIISVIINPKGITNLP